METAAEKYRRIKAEKEQLHDVECSDCGMVWKGRKTGVDFWVTSGILPFNFVETVLNAIKGTPNAKPEDLVKSMAATEVIKSIEFAAKVVKYTAVEPRIVEHVKDEALEISQEETLQCCFNRLLKWQMSGGAEAERLGNFPSERADDPVDRSGS